MASVQQVQDLTEAADMFERLTKRYRKARDLLALANELLPDCNARRRITAHLLNEDIE
jgi:uncharacterized membrane-anchored protein YhcB (DUF1043 family)